VRGLFLIILWLGSVAQADGTTSDRLVIHAAEFGIGRFHRYDNSVHPYSADNAWRPYILPDSVKTFDKPVIKKNSDGSFSVFFSNLEDLISSVIKISKAQRKKISVFNMHAHGAAGGSVFFPKNAYARDSEGCAIWRDLADASDLINYQKYYSQESKLNIEAITKYSSGSAVDLGCNVGLWEWQEAVNHNPEIRRIFADDAQIRFLSCRVGLGDLGDAFTNGIAELLLPAGRGVVESSLDAGLGDWSTPLGFEFLVFNSDEDFAKFNSIYPTERKDSTFAGKGTIRRAHFNGGVWQTELLQNQNYMPLGFDSSVTSSH
jgi:hypothetical protein